MNSLMHVSEYSAMYRSEEKLWWYLGLRDMLRDQFGKYLTKGSSILDAGCGTGKNIEFLTQLGYKVEGFDYSADAVEFCKLRGLDQVKQGDITAIDYPDDSFDAVNCMDVIGLLDDEGKNRAAQELMRVLKPGGILICHSAALEIFRSQHDVVTNLKTRLDKRKINSLFEAQGAEVLKTSYRIFLLSPLVLLFKTLKRITGKEKDADTSSSDQVIFPFGINWLLLQVQLLENKLFKRSNLPFGSSVVIVLRKK
jgi:SAM-dependent methyltransferase